MIEVNDRIQIPTHEYTLSFARSSGPGGQNVNKVNSKVVLSWDVVGSSSITNSVRQRFMEKFGNRINQSGEVVITGEKFRDQPHNIKDCKDKLKEMILEVFYPPKKRVPTKPSRGSQERRIQQKKNRSDIKKNRKKIDY